MSLRSPRRVHVRPSRRVRARRYVWGLADPILGRALRRMREAFPRATVLETEAGHFLQEEVPGPLAEAIIDVAGKVSKSVL